jgi:ankyrin repeat protein
MDGTSIALRLLPAPGHALIFVMGLLLLVGMTGARAQTPPSPSEIAAYTGLHKAVAAGDLAETAKLIATRPDLEARDGNGRTPLHVAAFVSNQPIAQALVKAGANPKALDNQRYDIITIAAVKDDPAFMRLAIALGGDPRAMTSPYDGTALIAAAHLGHDEVVRDLIAAKAPLDHVNNLGWTALIEAVILGDGGKRHVAIVEALVKAGANPNIADRSGVTPLRHAMQRGYGPMVEILKKAGGT